MNLVEAVLDGIKRVAAQNAKSSAHYAVIVYGIYELPNGCRQVWYDVIGPLRRIPSVDIANFLDEVGCPRYSIQVLQGDLRSCGLNVNETVEEWQAEVRQRIWSKR